MAVVGYSMPSANNIGARHTVPISYSVSCSPQQETSMQVVVVQPSIQSVSIGTGIREQVPAIPGLAIWKVYFS